MIVDTVNYNNKLPQFDEEQKSKESGLLKAQIVGPAWISDPVPSDQARYLSQFAAVWSNDMTDTEPIDPFARVQPVAQMKTDSAVKNDKKELPVAGELIIRLVKRTVQWHDIATLNCHQGGIATVCLVL